MTLLKRIWRDDAGVIATTDLILVTVILVLGMIVGLATFRDQVVQEFGDLATAIGRLNQSYSFEGDNDSEPDGVPDDVDDCFVAGSSYEDATDFGEEDDLSGQEPAGISVSTVIGDLDESNSLP